MSFNDNVRANVQLLEARAREAALQEVDRATGIDQKATALIAAGLVLVAAGVAFATGIGNAHAGSGARLLWALLLVGTLALLLASLGLATAAVRPRVFRIVLHMNVLNKWASTRYLDRDPTRVRGELMQGSVAAMREARVINKTKADRLLVAFAFFAAAILAIVVLGSAVAFRLAPPSETHVNRRNHTTAHRAGVRPTEPTSTPPADASVTSTPPPDLDAPLFDTPQLDLSLRESDDRIERRDGQWRLGAQGRDPVGPRPERCFCACASVRNGPGRQRYASPRRALIQHAADGGRHSRRRSSQPASPPLSSGGPSQVSWLARGGVQRVPPNPLSAPRSPHEPRKAPTEHLSRLEAQLLLLKHRGSGAALAVRTARIGHRRIMAT